MGLRCSQLQIAMALADDSCHEIRVGGVDGSALDVRDLEERVGAPLSPAFAMDDLTHQLGAFMRLHQHCIADPHLQEDRFMRKAAGDWCYRPPDQCTRSTRWNLCGNSAIGLFGNGRKSKPWVLHKKVRPPGRLFLPGRLLRLNFLMAFSNTKTVG